MAEYNPSKIIKDGNTYNFRDTTKIPLSGSNAISGDLIPSTDNSIDIGSSTKNLKMLYTKGITINGTQFLPSDYVERYSTQTIGGVKTFYTSATTYPIVKLKTAFIEQGLYDSDNLRGVAFRCADKNDAILGDFGYKTERTGEVGSYFSARTKVNNTQTTREVKLRFKPGSTDCELVPDTTNLIDLGGSQYQWNNAYIKSLTINGVACGDILTHNVSEFVNVNSAQTISGVKTFSDGLFASKSGQGDLATLEDSSINSTNEDANGMPLTGHTNSIKIKGSQVNVIPCMLTGKLHTNGNTEAGLYAYKYKDLTANASLSLRYNYNGNYGTVTFDNINSIIPGTTNTTNLGASALQWNKLYARNILIDNDINIASSLINKTSNSGMLSIRSALTNQDGASIALYSKDYSGGSSFVGNISMTAYGNSDYTIFRIYPNGAMSVYNNSAATTKIVAMQEDTVPRSGGAVMTDYFLGRSVDTGSLMISGGTSWSSGGSLETFGSSHSSYAGWVRLQPALSNANFKTMNLEPSGTWSWSGTACQITSDQRLKQQITEIDDKLLDAWGDVELVQFKYNESVDTKGKSARLHTGYVVQQIDKACKSHGVDISAYGLYCHEEYPQETEEVEVEQKDGTKTKKIKVIKEANEHYSLRYTEALIVECKYLRRCIARLTARIEELEKGNNSK